MSRFLVVLVLLTLVYALALASLDPWDLLTGAFVSGVLLLLFRQFVFLDSTDDREVPVVWKRIPAFFPFAWAVLRDVLHGTWQVALVTLHRRPVERSGTVEVPIDNRTRNGVAVTALVTTLSPGSVLVDVDWEQEIMVFHVLDATDREAVRAEHHKFYRRFQRHVFP